jgi:hypothetical protein
MRHTDHGCMMHEAPRPVHRRLEKVRHREHEGMMHDAPKPHGSVQELRDAAQKAARQGRRRGMPMRASPWQSFACAKHASNPAGTSGSHHTIRAAAFCMHSSTSSNMTYVPHVD